MSISITLSDSLADQLQNLAQFNQISVDELAEQVLAGYITDQTSDEETDMLPHESEEFKASLVEAKNQMDAGLFYTQEEIDQRIANKIKDYKKHNASNGVS